MGKPVQLQVSGSLEDSIGRLIDGDDNGAVGGRSDRRDPKEGGHTGHARLGCLDRSRGRQTAAVDLVLDQQMLADLQMARAAVAARQAEAAFARSLVEGRVRRSRTRCSSIL